MKRPESLILWLVITIYHGAISLMMTAIMRQSAYGGQRRKRYLKEHRKELYAELLTSGKLNGYLKELDEQAQDMFSWLVQQMADREGVTERLKADDQMAWVGRMNSIRGRARETVNNEFIYN